MILCCQVSQQMTSIQAVGLNSNNFVMSGEPASDVQAG
jgi:hypothetical protein